MISRIKSFKYAFSGLGYVIRTQKNAWIHALVSALVISLAFLLQCSSLEWAVLILSIGMVWMAEFINTALETAVDLATSKFHPLAKIGKDVGAAAVLIAASAAAVIGVLILGPRLIPFLIAQ
ncbi:MAG: diacylglycerol kinase family protein [Chloroflexi bacterium]|nr:diacylglycerol kinase family protein [Chloroflexota bacterium]